MTKQPETDAEAKVPAHKGIAAALAAAQAEMGRAKKSASNPHFKSKYADLDSVCDAALPALNRHGIAVAQPLVKDGDDWLVMTRFVHGDTDEAMETPMPLLLGKRDMQGLGSAITYARRYGLMTLAGIAPEDDDGNAAVASGEAPHRQQPSGPSQAEIDAVCLGLKGAPDVEALRNVFLDLPYAIKSAPDVIAAKDARKAELDKPAETQANADLGGDEIPY